MGRQALALLALLFVGLVSAASTSARQETGRTVLDQGYSPRCTAYAAASYMLNTPGPRFYVDPSRLWEEAIKVDGVPENDNDPAGEYGSHVYAMMAVLEGWGKLDGYDVTRSALEAEEWLARGDGVIVSSLWYRSMRELRDGFAVPPPRGFRQYHQPSDDDIGHAYYCYAADAESGVWYCQNTWGTEWGEQGLFKMHRSDVQRVVTEYGGYIHHPWKPYLSRTKY